MSQAQAQTQTAAPPPAADLLAAANSQASIEFRYLLETAQAIEDLSTRLRAGVKVPRGEIAEILTTNRRLWHFVHDGVTKPGCPLPQELRNNIIALSMFVFKRTIDALCETTPEKIQILVGINRSIAAGLAGVKPESLPAG